MTISIVCLNASIEAYKYSLLVAEGDQREYADRTDKGYISKSSLGMSAFISCKHQLVRLLYLYCCGVWFLWLLLLFQFCVSIDLFGYDATCLFVLQFSGVQVPSP